MAKKSTSAVRLALKRRRMDAPLMEQDAQVALAVVSIILRSKFDPIVELAVAVQSWEKAAAHAIAVGQRFTHLPHSGFRMHGEVVEETGLNATWQYLLLQSGKDHPPRVKLPDSWEELGPGILEVLGPALAGSTKEALTPLMPMPRSVSGSLAPDMDEALTQLEAEGRKLKKVLDAYRQRAKPPGTVRASHRRRHLVENWVAAALVYHLWRCETPWTPGEVAALLSKIDPNSNWGRDRVRNAYRASRVKATGRDPRFEPPLGPEVGGLFRGMIRPLPKRPVESPPETKPTEPAEPPTN